jgi:hypothetical protein
MLDEQALLIAIPIRHLRSALASLKSTHGTAVLPAGGPGDLDSTPRETPVLVMTADDGDGDADVPAATWAATFVRRVPYAPGSPWPDGVPPSWTEEHAVPEPDIPEPEVSEPGVGDAEDDDEDEWEQQEEDDLAGPQSFLEVAELRQLPRDEWLFANELVGKQARGGRSFRPRVPTIVALPD